MTLDPRSFENDRPPLEQRCTGTFEQYLNDSMWCQYHQQFIDSARPLGH